MRYDEYKKYPTAPGWYCIGMERMDGAEQERLGPDFGQIYHFDGAVWSDEAGDAVESIYDAALHLQVSMDAADYYVRQA